MEDLPCASPAQPASSTTPSPATVNAELVSIKLLKVQLMMCSATLVWLLSAKAATKLLEMSAIPAFLELQSMPSPTSALVMLDSIKTSQFVMHALINALPALLQLSVPPALTTPPGLSVLTASATLVSMMLDQPYVRHALSSAEPVHQPLPVHLVSLKTKEF